MPVVMSSKELKRLVALEMGYRPQDVDVEFHIEDISDGYQGLDPCYELVQAILIPKKEPTWIQDPHQLQPVK